MIGLWPKNVWPLLQNELVICAISYRLQNEFPWVWIGASGYTALQLQNGLHKVHEMWWVSTSPTSPPILCSIHQSVTHLQVGLCSVGHRWHPTCLEIPLQLNLSAEHRADWRAALLRIACHLFCRKDHYPLLDTRIQLVDLNCPRSSESPGTGTPASPKGV